MPKKYVLKGKGNYAKHNYEDMAKAIQCVKEGTSIRAAAAKYGIAKSTLSDRISGKTDLYGSSGRNAVLPEHVEKEIINQATASAEKGFGVSRKQMLSRMGILCRKYKVKGFKNETPSKHVWYGMKKRHPELTLRKPEKLGTVRARMLNPVVVEKYFKDLKDIISSLNLENKPHNVWNCDETGKSLEHTPTQVIAKKGTKHVVGRTSNDRSNITIMACANAAGEKMPPMLITKGKTSKCLFGYNTADAPIGSIWAFQEKAWMNEEICEQWFRDVFLQNCGPERPQLLLLDGHGSHETLGLLQLAIKERISILAFPPHTTHFLQPLDRTVFGPFNKSYNKACSEFLSAAPCNIVNKWTFPGLFKHAWEAGVTKENIMSGFKACGISPFNASAVPKTAYMPSSVYDKPQPVTHDHDNVDGYNSSVRDTREDEPTTISSLLANSTSNEIETAVASITEDQHTAPVEVDGGFDRILHIPTAAAPTTGTNDHTFNVSVEVHRGFGTSLSLPSDLSSDMHVGDPDYHTNIPDPSLGSARDVFRVEDPESLLELINTGAIDVCATADNDGVADLPSTLWNSDIEKLFSPEKQIDESEVPKKSRAIKSHRLLTSATIIEMKTQANKKKIEKAKSAEEKREKRERIKKEKAEKNTQKINDIVIFQT